MMSRNIFSTVLTICIIGIIIYLFLNKKDHQKVGYVYIKELYNGFEMKKEMERRYIQTKAARDKILDSMKFELNSVLKKIDSEKEKNKATVEEFQLKKEKFFQTKSSFEEENAKLTRQFDEQILSQLNQYVKDYGTQHQYSLLFGNDENGSLMFATEELNRTKEVLEFINEKYRGTK